MAVPQLEIREPATCLPHADQDVAGRCVSAFSTDPLGDRRPQASGAGHATVPQALFHSSTGIQVAQPPRREYSRRLMGTDGTEAAAEDSTLQVHRRGQMATDDWLRTNLKIQFTDFNFHDESPNEVPYIALFEDVRAIGRTDYEAYVAPIFLENRRKPWRSNMKARASQLSRSAVRCLATQQNETEWRAKVEGKVTDRFDTEVNCARCRAAIWLAEKDPTVATNFVKPRKECQCKPRDKDDHVDNGLSRIFDYHAGAGLEFDESIPPESRKHPRPDRVYGLRNTDRINRLLQESLSPDGDLIGDTVRSSPFLDKDEKLLFPFLVSEVKAERAAGSRSHAQKQSACAIITCLELQAKLVETVELRKSGHPSLEQRPLVWFLCSKGEQWYVSVASVVEAAKSAIRYRVDTLWSGRITDTEAALRLLLIMDYVFDWAREVYRKNIIDQILALAANPTSSLAADTDMLTVTGDSYHDADRGFDFLETQSPREATDQQAYSTSDLFEIFDTDTPTAVALRDARYMTHDVVGIDVTPNNMEGMLQSISEHSRTDRIFLGKILNAIHEEHSWRISAETLDAIEFVWTGFDREHEDFRDKNAKFLVNFTISSHLNGPAANLNERQLMTNEPPWHQRHTLQFVAAAESAIELIYEKSRSRDGAFVRGDLDVKKEEAVGMFAKIRHAPVRHCLAAALSCVERMTSRGFSTNSQGVLCDDQPVFANIVKGHQTSELPIKTYFSLKTGRSEPKSSFLRLSSSPFQELAVEENAAINWLCGGTSIREEDKVVFARITRADLSVKRTQGWSHCVFVIDPACSFVDRSTSHPLQGEASAEDGHAQKQAQPSRSLHPSLFNVCPPPKFQRSPVAATIGEPVLYAFESRDLDWFLEHVQIEWWRLNRFIRCLEEGYYVPGFENISKKIHLRYGAGQEVQSVVQILVGIGTSLQFRQLIKYLRDLISGADLAQDDVLGKGKGKAKSKKIEISTMSIPSFKHSKRSVEEDHLDRPGPSKLRRSDRTSPSLEASDIPLTSPSLYPLISLEDEDEDRIVRLSLSRSAKSPSRSSR